MAKHNSVLKAMHRKLVSARMAFHIQNQLPKQVS